MKNQYLLILLLSAFTALAQTSTEEIAESEMKSASRLMNLEVNPNTLNYDITYHKLEFTVDPADYFISGVVTTTFTALATMSTVTFDLTNELDVSSVTMNDSPLSFTQNVNDELVITLPSSLSNGASGTVVITYSGQPSNDSNAFTATEHNNDPIISTLSQPYGARDWWPCKQDLNDKVNSIDVYITAPSEYVSVSNGLEMSAEISGGLKTTHFHHGYPIPAYLVAIAVTNYEVHIQEAGTAPNNFPIVNYIYPEDYFEAISEVEVTLPIMNLFETLFETYPFSNEKYGHAQWNVGGGMEHSTVSFMGGFSRNLIAHELGHQWFGDKITCGTWQDIWLNEGFAEYLAGLVYENLDGNDIFTIWKGNKIQSITSQPGGSVYVPEDDLNNVGRIFSSRLTYNKGAMVVHMLRYKLGDAVFFQGVKNYLADPALAYAYAVTDDFQSHMESASGLDLDEFFNDWVYNEGYPSYTVTVHNLGNGQAEFTINQSQSHSSVDFFEMPVLIRINGPGGVEADVILDNTSDNQVIIADVPFVVSSAEVNPENDIITGFNDVNLATGNFNAVEAISLYPNPAASSISVMLPNSLELQSVKIHNILGQVEMQTADQVTWDISALSAGIHFMTLETDKGVKTLKFVKE